MGNLTSQCYTRERWGVGSKGGRFYVCFCCFPPKYLLMEYIWISKTTSRWLNIDVVIAKVIFRGTERSVLNVSTLTFVYRYFDVTAFYRIRGLFKLLKWFICLLFYLQCFSCGAELGTHKRDHSYKIFVSVRFQVSNSIFGSHIK